MKYAGKLRNRLLLTPSFVIISCFAVILLVFNLAVQNYIDSTTANQVNEELQYHKSYHQSAEDKKSPKRPRGSNIVSVNHIILDASQSIVYPTQQRHQQGRRALGEDIAAQVLAGGTALNTDQPVKIKLEDAAYYVKTEQIRGSFDGYSVTDGSGQPQTYTLLVYADISPIQSFMDQVNHILILLMIVFSVISIIIIFGLVRNIDHSLERLKLYLRRVGKRERVEEVETLPYQEFNDVAKTMQEMSVMIEKAEQSQTYFFQNASHELRTPLMSIQGYAEALQQNILEKEEALGIILKESDKMSTLVDEILFLSRMDSEGEAAHSKVFDLKELIYECAWRIQAEADKRDIIIDIDFPAGTVLVSGIEQQIERAINNVLSNALRYAKSRISIVCRTEEKEHVISIINDGKTISAERLPHIFERFYKGEDGNFGIGLSIAYEVMRKHQSSIDVYSNEQNTGFVFHFPIV